MLNLTGSGEPFERRGIVQSIGRSFAAIIAFGLSTAHSAFAGWSTRLWPVLAQAKTTPTSEPAAETTWPILDWLIVIALVGAALYVICRSSRRN
jgi:hypothetical protein